MSGRSWGGRIRQTGTGGVKGAGISYPSILHRITLPYVVRILLLASALFVLLLEVPLLVLPGLLLGGVFAAGLEGFDLQNARLVIYK